MRVYIQWGDAVVELEGPDEYDPMVMTDLVNQAREAVIQLANSDIEFVNADDDE